VSDLFARKNLKSGIARRHVLTAASIRAISAA
jgi:hypothetical protein